MNLNKSFITKIENINNITRQFDELFKYLNNITNNNITPDNIKKMHDITNLYYSIRKDHGSLIIILEQIKKIVLEQNSLQNNELENKLFNISSFYSILNSASDIINNIDYQYKKLALKFPDYVNKRAIKLLLFINKNNENEKKYIKIIDDIEKIYPENEYKIFEINNNPPIIINLNKIININTKIKIEKTPTFYTFNGDTITELLGENINNVETLINLLK